MSAVIDDCDGLPAGMRVAAGAAWLDKRAPGWSGRVRVDDLDLLDGCRCVLGQVFDTEGRDASCSGFNWVLRRRRKDQVWMVGHGFVPAPSMVGDAAALRGGWVSAVNGRNRPAGA